MKSETSFDSRFTFHDENKKETQMKKYKFLLFLLLLLSVPARAQFFQELPDSIAVGDSASAGVDLKSMHLLAISTPDTLANDTLTFWTSPDNVTWEKVYFNSGSGSISTELKIIVVAGKYNVLAPKEVFFFRRYIKIQYGTDANDGGTDAAGANDLFTIIAGYY
ncbi:MAG TPA: hypothetical protein DCX45_03600 [Acinetobacter junii]|nr:hypothetical protein [Acinetobacter junii]